MLQRILGDFFMIIITYFYNYTIITIIIIIIIIIIIDVAHPFDTSEQGKSWENR